jgi:hypothetical protein
MESLEYVESISVIKFYILCIQFETISKLNQTHLLN